MNFFRFASLPAPPRPPRRPPAPPLARRRNGSRAPVFRARAVVDEPTPPRIVGRWKEPEGSDSVEFRADGTLLEHATNGDGVRGHYALAGDHLSIRIDGVEPLAFSVSINGATMELKDAQGQVTRYLRM
jgi:Family of unknown function (DUF5640)